MLLSEWKKAEAKKKQKESMDSLKEALKAWREAEAETRLENQRKTIIQSASIVEGHRDDVSASFTSAFSSHTSSVQTVNNFILEKGSRMVCFSGHPNGIFGSQVPPSQFRHADDGEEKEKTNDVWACTEWEPQLIVQDIRASTGKVERWERLMESKSRPRLPAETWRDSWLQRRDDAPASPIEAI